MKIPLKLSSAEVPPFWFKEWGCKHIRLIEFFRKHNEHTKVSTNPYECRLKEGTDTALVTRDPNYYFMIHISHGTNRNGSQLAVSGRNQLTWMCIQQWKWWQVGTHLRQTTSLKSGRRGQAAKPKPPVRTFQSKTSNLATRQIILTRAHFGTMLVSLLNATVSLKSLMLRHSGPWFNIKLSSYQKTLRFCRPEGTILSSQAIQGGHNGGSAPLLRQRITIDFIV